MKQVKVQKNLVAVTVGTMWPWVGGPVEGGFVHVNTTWCKGPRMQAIAQNLTAKQCRKLADALNRIADEIDGY